MLILTIILTVLLMWLVTAAAGVVLVLRFKSKADKAAAEVYALKELLAGYESKAHEAAGKKPAAAAGEPVRSDQVSGKKPAAAAGRRSARGRE